MDKCDHSHFSGCMNLGLDGMSSLNEIAQRVSGGNLGSKPHALSSVVLLSLLNLFLGWKNYRNDLSIPGASGILCPSPLWLV